jgi:hypothetical protein
MKLKDKVCIITGAARATQMGVGSLTGAYYPRPVLCSGCCWRMQ